MLRIPLKPSPRLVILLAAGHAAAAACVLIVPLASWMKASLLVGLIASLAHAWATQAWRKAASSVVAIQCEPDGALLVTTRDGKARIARVLPSSFVAPYLTIIVFKFESARTARSVVIAPDALPPELFRQLRVWLKWRVGRGAEPDASSGWAGRL